MRRGSIRELGGWYDLGTLLKVHLPTLNGGNLLDLNPIVHFEYFQKQLLIVSFTRLIFDSLKLLSRSILLLLIIVLSRAVVEGLDRLGLVARGGFTQTTCVVESHD